MQRIKTCHENSRNAIAESEAQFFVAEDVTLMGWDDHQGQQQPWNGVSLRL